MSIRQNFFYSSILTTAGYIFPLITYPYVSRILGVANIGVCNFVDSIVNYFVLFSMMGIRTIGIREIAKCNGDKAAMSETFSNLLFLNLFFVLIFSVIFFIVIQIVPQFAEHKVLMYVGIAKLFATFMLIDWLYKGIEDFKYITIRSLIIRCIYVISIFILVRSKDDYQIYFVLLVLTEGINAMINCIHARKFVNLKIKKLHPFKYINSSITIGVYGFLTTMYTTFNVAYLGFVTNTIEVGYYTTATKLHHIVLALFTAFTGVMLPRMSKLIAEGKGLEFTRKINQSYSILISFSFPVIVLGICFSSEIIQLISGAGYDGAILPLMIVMPLVFVIGLEQVFVHQILMPQKKDKAILVNSVLGAVVGVGLNILLVGRLGSVGSALVWFFSELCVLCSATYFVKDYILLMPLKKKILSNLLLMLPAFFLCMSFRKLFESSLLAFVLSCALLLVYYGYIYVFIFNDENILSLLSIKINKNVKR